MFYSQFILAKKGPLGTIWIAAHLERKLRKNQVADTDIGVSVDSILSPDVPIALRLSSHLLLGVVRIYSRKVNYLFHDCSEALLKVKQAFRSTAVDLPPEESTAPYHSITLPETFDLDDFELPDTDDFPGNFVDHHVSTREQITLQDSMDTVVYSTSQFGLDERFGDGDTSQGFDLDEELFLDKLTASEHTVLLFDSDNVDPQASGQPMTPFTGMDIDDDTDLMADEGKMAKVVPTGSKVEIDLNAQDVKIVDDSAPLWGSPNRGFNFDGHDLPTKLVETSSMDPTTEVTNWGPDTPRFMEAVSPINNYTNEGLGHARVNETSLSSSQEVTMHEVTNNLQLDLEHCDPKLVPQNILENLPSKVQFEVTNEAGDCSLLNNEISELDISKMPQDTQVKQQGGSAAVVDANSISVDVGRPISSPTSVLTEQLKPTSPASTVLDDASALPVIMERTGKSGGTTNEDPTFSNVDLVHTEGVPVPGTMDIAAASTSVETCDKPVLSCVGVSAFPGTMDIAAAFTSVETCNKPILSRGGVSANCKPSNDSWTISSGTSGCIPYMEHSGSEAPSKVGPPGDIPVSMPYVTSGCIPHKEYSGSEAPLKVGPPGDMPISMPYVTSGCIPHKEYSDSEAPLKVGPPGDSPVSMPNVPHPLLGSLGAVEFNKDESRACSEREVTNLLHVVSIDKESSGHGGVLRPCNSLSGQRDTIIPAKKDSLLNAPDLSPMAVYNSLSRQPDTVIPIQGGFQLNTRDMSPMRAEPCSLAMSGQMPVRTAGFSTAVQGETFQPTGIWNTVPAFYPSNGLGTHVSSFETVISRDSQSGNLHYPANREVAVPDLEGLRSASASISFPPSDLLRHSTSEKNVFAKGVVSKESQLGHSNYPASYESPLPEPERMLSAPAEIPFAPSNFLMHSTSEKQVFTMSEGSGSGLQTLSGKKRQLMESDLVLRDSSAKRSGMQSKATVGFIPNDYDVLSSILASKPSVLKLKPTPSQSDIASKKRTRVTPRTSVAKRKVLLDDTMVLHGDTIRQQLTSTEDIRRIRKKAPCTRPEIWMIQKLLLEDEVFSETLFTGMSSDLVGLHNRTYGVNIKAPQMDVDHMLPEVQDVVMLSNSGHLMAEANTEGTENGSNVNESMESSKQIENRLSEQHQINSVECDGQEQTRCVAEISPFHFQKGELDITATMESDNVSGAADMLNTASTAVGEFAFGTRTISEDRCNETVGSEIELSVNKTNGIDKILHNDGNFDIHSVAEKDGVISDRSKEREYAAISASEVNREGPPLTEGVPEEQNGSLNNSNGAEIVLQNDGNLDLQSVEKDAFIIERSNGREDDAIYASEVNRKSTLLADSVPVEKDGSVQDVIESSSVGVVPQFIAQDPQDNVSVGCLPPTNIMLDSCSIEKNADVVPDATTPLENRESPFPNILVTSEGLSDSTGVTNDYVEEVTWSEPGHVGNENAGESVRDEAGNLTSSLMSIENPQRDFSDALEFDTNTETVPYDEGKNPGSQDTDLERTVVTENLSNRVANPEGTVNAETTYRVANPEGTVNAETTSLNNASVDTSFDLENTFDEDDTEFLNFDDDEELEEEDNPMPNTEEAKILDTSGWSSRTRGVARYLQTQFDAETGHGRKVLCMDNLLSGKTRKEASRMFFETLVLKTRDYVHVEQENPFDVINIKPRGKLVKSTF